MEKILVITLNSEKEAFVFSQKLSELDNNADISIAESIILSKDDKGKGVVKNLKGDVIPLTAGGAVIGSIVGILGGPVGILLGASLGALAGAVGDIIGADELEEYLDKLSDAVPAGKTAVIIHADEDWVTPVDTIAAEFGAEVKRLNVDEEIEKRISDDLGELDTEIEQLSLDLERSTGEVKASIKEKIDSLKKKRKEFVNSANKKVAGQKEKYENWVSKLKNKLEDWKDDVENTLEEKKKERLKKQIERQEEKLERLKNQL